MANDLNQCSFIGRLGKDPESRFLPNGGQVVSLSIACGSSWTDKNSGQRQEKTDWIPVVIFGKLAEIAGQYLKKGSKVFIQGSFKTRKWQDQSGNDRYSTEIVIDGFNGQMQMLDGAGGQGNNPAQQPQQPQQQMSANNPYQQASGGNQRPMSQQPMTNHRVTQGAQNMPNNGTPAGGGDFDDGIPFATYLKNTFI